MFRNFKLAAIVNTGRGMQLQQIPLHRRLQDTLAEGWYEQYMVFMDERREINFDAGYNPEEDECFKLENFELPDWLAGQDSGSIIHAEHFRGSEEVLTRTKGIAAFARDENDNEHILFQNFNRSHIIKPGFSLFTENDTYTSNQRPGLTLDNKLGAVFVPSDAKLLFRSFRIVNTFLPLIAFYEEASETQIREVLNHPKLAAESIDALANNASQWFRKRIAMLHDSGILDRYTSQQIADHSEGYDVNIQLNGDQIVFPADKGEAKRLLQFLNEEIYKGAITETLYETNSKREAD